MPEPIVNSKESAEQVELLQGGAVTSSGVTSSGVVTHLEVDYTITDTNFQPFKVYKTVSHNGEVFGRPAWWGEKRKVERLIEAFKAGHMVKDACFYAGISEKQWQAFTDMHVDFALVKEACLSYQRFAAMDAVNKALPNDPKLSLQYLKLRHPDFKNKVQVESDQPLAPTVNVAISNEVDTTKIAELLASGMQRLIAEREHGAGDSDPDGGYGVEEAGAGVGT